MADSISGLRQELVEGAAIELRQMTLVGCIVAAMAPGYWWMRRSTNRRQVYERTAIVVSVLLGAALIEGARARK